MLVATFGPNTAWQGREIIWDVDRFILVGHGAIPAAGVLDYDRLGQLVWARPSSAPGSRQVDALGDRRAACLAGPRRLRAPALRRPAAQPPRAAAACPPWAIVLIVARRRPRRPQHRRAPSSSRRSSSAPRRRSPTTPRSAPASAPSRSASSPTRRSTAGSTRAAGEVNGVGLSRYISAWPVNPYTDLPMADGGGAGNFRYDAERRTAAPTSSPATAATATS